MSTPGARKIKEPSFDAFSLEEKCRKVVADCGGSFSTHRLRLGRALCDPPPDNGGCGRLTAVSGTNGGGIPCGSMITFVGVTAPYYCAACTANKGLFSAHDSPAEVGEPDGWEVFDPELRLIQENKR